MTEYDGFRMFYGAANGSAQKALRRVEEPDVLVNYRSHLNKPPETADRIFVDSGGYSLMAGGGTEYTTPVDEYLDFVVEHDADRFVCRDYPCEPHLLSEVDRSVREHQKMTLAEHRHTLAACYDRGLDAEPIAVVQGWEVEDYLRHVEMLRDAGVLTPTVGVGSICRRGATDQIRKILQAVDSRLPSDVTLHAFGVKQQVLGDRDTREAVDTVDTSGWYQNLTREGHPDERRWLSAVHRYVEYNRKLHDLSGRTPHEGQTSLDVAADGGGGGER